MRISRLQRIYNRSIALSLLGIPMVFLTCTPVSAVTLEELKARLGHVCEFSDTTTFSVKATWVDETGMTTGVVNNNITVYPSRAIAEIVELGETLPIRTYSLPLAQIELFPEDIVEKDTRKLAGQYFFGTIYADAWENRSTMIVETERDQSPVYKVIWAPNMYFCTIYYLDIKTARPLRIERYYNDSLFLMIDVTEHVVQAVVESDPY